MARILYWNINNFTDRKITNYGTPNTNHDLEWDDNEFAPRRLQMILNTFAPRDPATNAVVTLDFIVVVEVYARSGAVVEGGEIGDLSLIGCLNLLDAINHTLPGDWSLVPPVVTGTGGHGEAVAVYYNRTRWYFLGPETRLAAYPAPLAAGLPNRVIPAGYPYRGNTNERFSAGRWQFGTWLPGMHPDHDDAQHVRFPGADHRKPWLTAFGDVGNADNLIHLMSIHTKPNDLLGGPAYADQGTANLADVYDMTARPAVAPNQIDVIVGDFNVDNLDAANFAAGGPFGRLLGHGINPANPAYTALIMPGGVGAAESSYYHTHGSSVANARIMEDSDDDPLYWQRAGHYPGQEYSDLSIDNALVRYRGGAAAPAGGHHMTILARARELPYAAPLAVPLVPPALGYYRADVAMMQSIDQIYLLWGNPAIAASYDGNEYFQNSDNYRLVFSVSDHFALVFDV